VSEQLQRSQGVAVKLRSFSNSLPMSLLLAREAVMNRFRSALHLFNLTEQQWRVLRALNSVETIEVTALANATSLLAPSLTRILKDLESRGLIERKSSAADMRKSLIAISPTGLNMIDAVAPYSEQIYGEITDAFGPEKLAQLQQLLRELTESTKALPPADYRSEQLPSEIREIVGLRQRGRPRRSDK
jgi:homoprotocatechuate degradation regulator HpaR